MEEAKTKLKFVLVGDTSVGKSSICLEYFNPKSSQQSYLPTIHHTFEQRVEVNGKNVYPVVYDTNINEYDICAPDKLYPGTNFFVLCFNINEKKSFENVKKFYIEEIGKYSPESFKILVGTKIDQKDENSITKLEAEKLSKEINAIEYIETSSYERINIDEIFLHCKI
eukprot:gene7086-11249_t